MKNKKELEREERDIYEFNYGRKSADEKWVNAIDERIKELEKSVGIPELRRLKEKIKYKWDVWNDEGH